MVCRHTTSDPLDGGARLHIFGAAGCVGSGVVLGDGVVRWRRSRRRYFCCVCCSASCYFCCFVDGFVIAVRVCWVMAVGVADDIDCVVFVFLIRNRHAVKINLLSEHLW